MLNNTETIIALVVAALPAMRKSVIRVLKSPVHPEIDDVVNDAMVRILGSVERLETISKDEAHCATVAKNIAKDHCKRPANRPGTHGTVNDTDAGNSEDNTSSLGTVLAGPDGREVVARAHNLARLEAAKAELLDADEGTFLAALESGLQCYAAGALVGWSEATASRRRRDIIATLKVAVA